MSGQEDLDATIEELSVNIGNEIAALTAALANHGDETAIRASIARLQVLNDALKADDAPVVVSPPVVPVV